MMLWGKKVIYINDESLFILIMVTCSEFLESVGNNFRLAGLLQRLTKNVIGSSFTSWQLRISVIFIYTVLCSMTYTEMYYRCAEYKAQGLFYLDRKKWKNLECKTIIKLSIDLGLDWFFFMLWSQRKIKVHINTLHFW